MIMDFQNFVHNAFLGIIGFLGALMVYEVREMSDHINGLKIEIANVVHRVEMNSYRIDLLESIEKHKTKNH